MREKTRQRQNGETEVAARPILSLPPARRSTHPGTDYGGSLIAVGGENLAVSAGNRRIQAAGELEQQGEFKQMRWQLLRAPYAQVCTRSWISWWIRSCSRRFCTGPGEIEHCTKRRRHRATRDGQVDPHPASCAPLGFSVIRHHDRCKLELKPADQLACACSNKGERRSIVACRQAVRARAREALTREYARFTHTSDAGCEHSTM